MALDVDDLHLRTLTEADVDLVVEATSGETAASAWGPRPAGPYAPDDARRALREWSPDSRQVSYGAFDHALLVGVVGLMSDGPASAELAYWVRPERRGRGIATRAVAAATGWAHDQAGLATVWLEIDPTNVASRHVAERAGYRFDRLMPLHCRSWATDDPDEDTRHDCLIWISEASTSERGL